MTNLILLNQLCDNHRVDIAFLYSLNELGLFEIKTIQQIEYVEEEKVVDLEKMIRMHLELNLNIEAIGTIFNLTQKIESLQMEINTLNNRIKCYEEVIYDGSIENIEP